MQFEIGQMSPSNSEEKIYFKKTIFTSTTSPRVELSNNDCIKRPSLCVKLITVKPLSRKLENASKTWSV